MGFAGPSDPTQCSCDISAPNNDQEVKPIAIYMYSDPRDNLSQPGPNSSGKSKNDHLDIGLWRQVA